MGRATNKSNGVADFLREHWLELLLTLVAGGVGLIAWNHSFDIHDLQRDAKQLREDQARELDSVRADLRTANKKLDALNVSLTALLLDEKPDKSAIMKRLVSDASFAQGVEQFKSGKYTAAFDTWEHSAARGTAQSAFAIQAAKVTLEHRIQDPATPESERVELKAALDAAPVMEGRATLDWRTDDAPSQAPEPER